jgi:LPS-assembly protein
MLLFVVALVAVPVRALAQQPAPRTDTTTADRHDVINDKEHHYIGKVEFDAGDTKLYADDVWYYVDQNRAVATGNVVFRQGTNQISADRAEFDTKTRLGTFYNASGFATAQPPRQTAAPGGVALPPRTGQDTIVYFFGETVEKIGPKKYKIISGGFTTCVQPTPRWDLHAGTIVLNIDHYTLLKQAVMNVKGVPLFYLPILYYPTKKEDRATGFLLPTYGSSTLRGHQFHNAFFWAINRSQDATIMHDWYSKTGQGAGTEYRYDFGGGSIGNLRAHLDQQTATDLTTVKSYQLNGSANQLLPGKMRATARVDYFSDIKTNQALYTNIYDASSSRRNFGGNVVGAWGSYALTGTIDHNEYFYNQTSSTLSGSSPRITVNRNERPVAHTPLYFSTGAEYANIVSIGHQDGTEIDRSLTRLDFTPQIRFPFKKWQWFTANSTASWSDTYYTRSQDPTIKDPVTNQPTIIDDNLNRRYFTLQTQLTGPVFNRVWDTPDNGYAEKFKHTIEPFVTVARTSAIDNTRIVQLWGSDFATGGTTTLTYGVANRFYAKRRPAVAGQTAQAREMFTVELRQSYYSKKEAASFDPQYSTSNGVVVTANGVVANSNFAPIALSVRAQPTNGFNATANADFDSRYHALRTISVTGTYLWNTQLQSTLSWYKMGHIPQLPPYDDPANLNQSLNGSSTVRTKDNKYGAIYTFNYDVLRSTMLNEKISAFYNAQCCGIAFEYQTFHFVNNSISPIAADHRFFMSFTLAGLGNFSPFNGALSGVPR